MLPCPLRLLGLVQCGLCILRGLCRGSRVTQARRRAVVARESLRLFVVMADGALLSFLRQDPVFGAEWEDIEYKAAIECLGKNKLLTPAQLAYIRIEELGGSESLPARSRTAGASSPNGGGQEAAPRVPPWPPRVSADEPSEARGAATVALCPVRSVSGLVCPVCFRGCLW